MAWKTILDSQQYQGQNLWIISVFLKKVTGVLFFLLWETMANIQLQRHESLLCAQQHRCEQPWNYTSQQKGTSANLLLKDAVAFRPYHKSFVLFCSVSFIFMFPSCKFELLVFFLEVFFLFICLLFYTFNIIRSIII